MRWFLAVVIVVPFAIVLACVAVGVLIIDLSNLDASLTRVIHCQDDYYDSVKAALQDADNFWVNCCTIILQRNQESLDLRMYLEDFSYKANAYRDSTRVSWVHPDRVSTIDMANLAYATASSGKFLNKTMNNHSDLSGSMDIVQLKDALSLVEIRYGLLSAARDHYHEIRTARLSRAILKVFKSFRKLYPEDV